MGEGFALCCVYESGNFVGQGWSVCRKMRVDEGFALCCVYENGKSVCRKMGWMRGLLCAVFMRMESL